MGHHLQRQMARELDRRVDRFRRRSFVSSWHLWESSRRRHVQVGIREGLGTMEAGLMEHKMGSCGDVFWSAATGGGAALFSAAPVLITIHLYSTFRLMPVAASFHSPLSKSRIVTRLFVLHFFIVSNLMLSYSSIFSHSSKDAHLYSSSLHVVEFSFVLTEMQCFTNVSPRNE